MSLIKKLNKKYSSRTRANTLPPSMSVIGSAQPDVVRIKVYKPNSNTNDDSSEAGLSKKFCVDPRLTSYRTLQCLIAQAFDIKSDFTISAIVKCPVTGREQLTAIWSDWDLDASIQAVKPDSYLRLRYDLATREEGLDEWDFVGLNDFNSNIRWFNVDSRSFIATVNQTAGKAASAFNKAMSWVSGGNDRRHLKPIGETDIKKYMDNEARLIYVNEFRRAVYEAGVEPSFRKIVWRHLLNIFPLNQTGVERINYLKYVQMKYETLKKRWMSEQHQNEQIRSIMRMINKDVLRTDRSFGFYADSDDGNVNIQSLFHVLMTYCVSHPSITYCQGMNDYASTLLYVMREESLAYVCFCSIMRRIKGNFTTDGVTIGTKLLHLKVLLQAIDPVYWSFFESCDAVNLLFTYRWLLLECKREFSFNDALRVLEVMWSTLPTENEPPALSELVLITSPSDNMITEILSNTSNSIPVPVRRSESSPELFVTDGWHFPKWKRRSSSLTSVRNGNESVTPKESNSLPSNQIAIEHEQFSFSPSKTKTKTSDCIHQKTTQKNFPNSFSLSEISDFDEASPTTTQHERTTSSNIISQILSTTDWLKRLPMGERIWLDEENSFLLFICIGILLSRRSYLLNQENLDEQEISMHFDRFRRRHNADKVLHYAKILYAQFVQWIRKKRMIDDLKKFSTS